MYSISQFHKINFSKIVVSDTPSGIITMSSDVRPLTWCGRAQLLDRRALEVSGFQGLSVGRDFSQHYFSSLYPLGKMKIRTSLTIVRAKILTNNHKHTIFHFDLWDLYFEVCDQINNVHCFDILYVYICSLF